MREFDNDTILVINAFEKITGSKVRDCINAEFLCFLVNEGEVGAAIGKGGHTIKKAEEIFKKQIKIYEFSEDQTQFLKNLIPGAQNIVIKEERATVTVSGKDRGTVIGKSGSNV